MTTWHVLINPLAGRKSIAPSVLTAALEAASVSYRLEVVEGVAAMREKAVSVVEGGERLAIVGGDGTISAVVDAIVSNGGAGLDQPLGVLPTGTGCDLLRTFGRGTDLAEAAVRLERGSPYPIDVGYLDGHWGRRHFVNVAQAGVGAAAVEAAQQLPRVLGAARYPLGFARRLIRFPRAQVSIVGERWPTSPLPALAVILANGQFFGGGWNIAPKAMMSDGALDVQVIDAAKPRAPALVPKLMRGLHLNEPGVRRRPTASLTIETDVPWPIEADGDLVGTTPVAVGILPTAMSLQI